MSYNLVSTLAHSFLIRSSSYLQVTRTSIISRTSSNFSQIVFILAGTKTAIKAWMSSNFGRIPPLTSELAALEHLKKTNNKLVSTLAPSF